MATTVTSVYNKLSGLSSKITSLQTTLGATGSNGHNADLDLRSSQTLYGLPDEIGSQVDAAIAAINVAEQKVLAIYS